MSLDGGSFVLRGVRLPGREERCTAPQSIGEHMSELEQVEQQGEHEAEQAVEHEGQIKDLEPEDQEAAQVAGGTHFKPNS
jgi:hypothetical protein